MVLVIGTERALTEALYNRLQAATDRDVGVIVGALSRDVREQIGDWLPAAEVFETELDWLRGSHQENEEGTSIGVLAMVDRNVLLVSAFSDHRGRERTENGMFGRGFTNGFVVVARRLLARGLLSSEDPADDSEAFAADADDNDD